MIRFEKVSEEQFIKDTLKLFSHLTEEEIKEIYNNIKLPTRGSKGSAGYDIYSPFSFELNVGDAPVVFPLGIRAVMPENLFLQIVPRSGIGFKTGVRLANSLGIIDADFAESPSEGHIMIKLVAGFNDLTVSRGDRIAQGIFLQYFTTDDDNTTTTRKGGFGSTGK